MEAGLVLIFQEHCKPILRLGEFLKLIVFEPHRELLVSHKLVMGGCWIHKEHRTIGQYKRF